MVRNRWARWEPCGARPAVRGQQEGSLGGHRPRCSCCVLSGAGGFCVFRSQSSELCLAGLGKELEPVVGGLNCEQELGSLLCSSGGL